MLFSRSFIVIVSILSLILASCSNNESSSKSSGEGNSEKKLDGKWQVLLQEI